MKLSTGPLAAGWHGPQPADERPARKRRGHSRAAREGPAFHSSRPTPAGAVQLASGRRRNERTMINCVISKKTRRAKSPPPLQTQKWRRTDFAQAQRAHTKRTCPGGGALWAGHKGHHRQVPGGWPAAQGKNRTGAGSWQRRRCPAPLTRRHLGPRVCPPAGRASLGR